jgi:hypothetical protein
VIKNFKLIRSSGFYLYFNTPTFFMVEWGNVWYNG